MVAQQAPWPISPLASVVFTNSSTLINTLVTQPFLLSKLELLKERGSQRTMKKTLAILSLAFASAVGIAAAQGNHGPIKRVLLVSVDGMHAVDFQNCANGISTVNNG